MLVDAVKKHYENRMVKCYDDVPKMRPDRAVSVKRVEKRKCRDEDDTEYLQEDEQSYSASNPRKTRSKHSNAIVKQARQISTTVKTCCAKGYQKHTFEENNGKFSRNCQGNISLSHATLLHYHKC